MLDGFGNLGLRVCVELAARRTREAGMNRADATVTPQEERRRERAEVHTLRHFVGQLLGLAGQQHGVLDAVLLDERAKSDRILQLFRLLEREADDLQAAAAI